MDQSIWLWVGFNLFVLAKALGQTLESAGSFGVFCGATKHLALLLARTRYQGLGSRIYSVGHYSFHRAITRHKESCRTHA